MDFINMLDDYIEHLTENPDSLICRIYGIFTIKTALFSPVDIMVMQHTANLFNKKNKKYEFDLKGSLFQRYRTPFSLNLATKQHQKLPIYNRVLQDVNFRLLNDSHLNVFSK